MRPKLNKFEHIQDGQGPAQGLKKSQFAYSKPIRQLSQRKEKLVLKNMLTSVNSCVETLYHLVYLVTPPFITPLAGNGCGESVFSFVFLVKMPSAPK